MAKPKNVGNAESLKEPNVKVVRTLKMKTDYKYFKEKLPWDWITFFVLGVLLGTIF